MGDISSLWDKLDDAKEKLAQLKDSSPKSKSSTTTSKRPKHSSSSSKTKTRKNHPNPKSTDKYSKTDDHHKGVFQSEYYQDKYNSSPNSSINESLFKHNNGISKHKIQGVATDSSNAFKYAPDQILVSKIQQTQCPVSISSNEHQLEKLKRRIEAHRQYKQQQKMLNSSSEAVISEKQLQQQV